MEKWEKMCPSALTCTLYSIGKTFEDREIKMIKVSGHIFIMLKNIFFIWQKLKKLSTLKQLKI